MFLRTTPQEGGGYANYITNFKSSCEGEVCKEPNDLQNSLWIGQSCYLTKIDFNFYSDLNCLSSFRWYKKESQSRFE